MFEAMAATGPVTLGEGEPAVLARHLQPVVTPAQEDADLAEAVERLHGPELLAVLGAAGEPGDLAADDLLSLAEGWEKVACYAAAAQRRVIGELALRRGGGWCLDEDAGSVDDVAPGSVEEVPGRVGSDAAGAGREARWVSPRDYVAEEVALVLRCSVRTAESLVAESLDLVQDLPRTLDALTRGELSVPATRAVVQETAVLEPHQRCAVEANLLASTVSRLPARVRAATRRRVLAVDPRAARRREEAARRRRCVRTRPAPDGSADLVVEAPVTDVALAFENLDHHARRVHSRVGEERGIEAIRADLAIAALSGRVHLGGDAAPPPVPAAGEEKSQPGDHAGAAGDGPAGAGAGTGAGAVTTGPVPVDARSSAGRPRAVRAEVVVTVADSTLRGEDEQPGTLRGYGPVTAEMARELTGLAHDVDLLSAPRRQPLDQQPLDQRPLDQRPLDPRPLDPRPLDPRPLDRRPLDRRPHGGRSPESRPPGGDSPESPPSEHPEGGEPPPTTSYVPTAALVRHVVARDRTCRFPGCPRRAERCDLDHTVPYPSGPTSAGNLGALCRRHHRLKQSPAWTVSQPAPGTFVWTTPTGRTWTVRPPDPLDPG
ncbi:HNH endonuclease signature motif containing protein [Thalassiella azotivora]